MGALRLFLMAMGTIAICSAASAGPRDSQLINPFEALTATVINPDKPNADAQPRPAPPGPQVVRSFGFGNWPSAHLTAGCATLHDSYWTQGLHPSTDKSADHPDNIAYHTWHPAITSHPQSGEVCDFGHEHGFDPTHAPAEVFALSGGWPAFGYAAEMAGGPRHEDHVGHKITVAHFRAGIGNGAGSEPMFDAGFQCDWLSKIHQGSFSMDAFSNHLHEYFLTLRCLDGRNAQGVMDGATVGTEFSVKLMYTYGLPNQFIESNCSPASHNGFAAQIFDYDILLDPDGQPLMPAAQTSPIGNHATNHRGFVCASAVVWKPMDEVREVDLWTELIKINRNDGSTVITIQPYYIVKNPARIIQSYNAEAFETPSQVVRTVDLCYKPDGTREPFHLCAGAPSPKPADWQGWEDPRSPFNGTLRGVNFKASHLSNAGQARDFCTNAFGREVNDAPPCEAGNIQQTAATFDNHWNDGAYAFNGRSGNIQGSIWAEDPRGNRFEAVANADGSFTPLGIGFEFVVDNRDPDDDLDGQPDGAHIRGKN